MPLFVNDPSLSGVRFFNASIMVPIWAIFWSVVAFVWLVQAYRNTTDFGEKRSIGFVVVGSLISIGIPLLLSLIPGILLGRLILPWDYSFIFLIALPLFFYLCRSAI
ncbi:MAG: hypothetical protein AAF614_39425 [Chloroflexota bacterium]